MSGDWIFGAGFWLGLPVTGMLLLHWARIDVTALAPLPALRFCVLTAIGILGWSPVLLLTALYGHFVPSAFSLVGWVLLVAGAIPLARMARVAVGESRTESWGLVALLLVALLWSAAMPSEPILVGRDQGLYLNHALSIARTGSLVVVSPLDTAGMADIRTLLAPALPQGRWWLPGIFNTSNGPVVQFPAQFTVWLAQAQGSFGIGGLLRMNALFSTLAAGMFFLLLRNHVSAGIAFGATLFFVANPAQQWISRITLSEPLAQLLLISMLALLSAGIDKGSSRLGAAAACAGAIAMLARIDAVLLLPLTIAACALQRSLAPSAQAATAWRSYFLFTFAMLVPVGLYYMFALRPYTLYVLHELVAAGTATVAAAVGLATSSQWGPALRRQMQQQWIVAAFGILVIAGIAYATLVRPHWAPFVLIEGPYDAALLGLRDHREDSLVNLAAYLSPPVILLAALGVFQVFRRLLHAPSPAAADVLLLVVLTGIIVAMLWRPGVAPDHFWAIRRFVPLAIPGVIFFAAAGFASLTPLLAEERLRQAFYGASALLGFALLWHGNAVLQSGSEQKGMADQVGKLAAQVPEGLILAEDANELAVALWLGFGKAVVPLALQSMASKDALAAVQNKFAMDKRPVWLLSGSPLGHGYVDSAHLRKVRFAWTEIEGTTRPLPARWQPFHRDFHLLSHGRAEPNRLPAIWGDVRHPDAPDSGFYSHEISGNGLGRWTNGNATITLPSAVTLPPPTTLAIRVAAGRPQGSQLRVLVNGNVLFDGEIPVGVSVLGLPLAVPVHAGDRMSLQLISDTFVPSEGATSTDRRKLGVHLLGLALQYPDADAKPAALQNLAARMDLLDIPPAQLRSGMTSRPLVVRVSNTGTAAWNPTATDTTPAVALGIVWRAAGMNMPIVAERRTALPTSIRPEHYVTLTADLTPVDNAGKPLPSGEYQVTIDMVAEQQAWFAVLGSTPLVLNMTVLPRS